MAQIIWTNHALQDLTEIGEFINKSSPKFAQITVRKLFSKVDILIQNPRIGRVVPEQEEESIRELIEGNYRIIYELIDDQIYILTVHHSARILKL